MGADSGTGSEWTIQSTAVVSPSGSSSGSRRSSGDSGKVQGSEGNIVCRCRCFSHHGGLKSLRIRRDCVTSKVVTAGAGQGTRATKKAPCRDRGPAVESKPLQALQRGAGERVPVASSSLVAQGPYVKEFQV